MTALIKCETIILPPGFTPEEVRRYEETSSLPWLYTEQMYVGMKAMAKMGGIMLYVFLADRWVHGIPFHRLIAVWRHNEVRTNLFLAFYGNTSFIDRTIMLAEFYGKGEIAHKGLHSWHGSRLDQ